MKIVLTKVPRYLYAEARHDLQLHGREAGTYPSTLVVSTLVDLEIRCSSSTSDSRNST